MTNRDYTIFSILLQGNRSSIKREVLSRMSTGKKTTPPIEIYRGNFTTSHIDTLGIQPYTRYDTINGERVCYSIWRFSKDKKFNVLYDIYYQKKDGAVILFDLTDKTTLDEIDKWISGIRKQSPEVFIIIIGNNNSIAPEISWKEVLAKVSSLNANEYFEVNSLTDDILIDAFSTIGTSLFAKKKSIQETDQPYYKEIYVELDFNNITDVIEKNHCCIIAKEYGSKYCELCGRTVEETFRHLKSSDLFSHLLSKRYCCLQGIRNGHDKCKLCNNYIPYNYRIKM